RRPASPERSRSSATASRVRVPKSALTVQLRCSTTGCVSSRNECGSGRATGLLPSGPASAGRWGAGRGRAGGPWDSLAEQVPRPRELPHRRVNEDRLVGGDGLLQHRGKLRRPLGTGAGHPEGAGQLDVVGVDQVAGQVAGAEAVPLNPPDVAEV